MFHPGRQRLRITEMTDLEPHCLVHRIDGVCRQPAGAVPAAARDADSRAGPFPREARRRPLARRRGGGSRRPDRCREPGCRFRRDRRRLPPGACDGDDGRLRRRRAPWRRQRGGRRATRGRQPHRLSRWAAPRGRPAVAAPHLPHRGRANPEFVRRRDDRPAGGRHHRSRLGVVRDGPPPDQPPARHDHAQVGAQQDPADRRARRPALPHRGGDRAGRIPKLGHRRSRCPRIRRDDADLCRGRRAPPTLDPGTAVADADDCELVGRPGDADPAGARTPACRVAAQRRRRQRTRHRRRDRATARRVDALPPRGRTGAGSVAPAGLLPSDPAWAG